MSATALQTIIRQIEQLNSEEKWTLFSLLTESLHRQTRPAHRTLSAYVGRGEGRGFQTTHQVDAFIRQERDLWDK